MFKYLVALAFVAVASATQYYVDIGETYVKVGNEQGLQVTYYVDMHESYPIIHIQFFTPEGLVKEVQVPYVKGQDDELYQIFTQYAGQQLSYAAYQDLVSTIYKYVQANNIDPVFFYALQVIDIALYNQLYQGDYYRYIQNVLNKEGYGSWSQGMYGYQPYGYGYSGSYGKSYQAYGPYSSGYGLYGSSRYGKPSAYGYFGGYQGYSKPYGYGSYAGYYGSQSYSRPYGYGYTGAYGKSLQGYSWPQSYGSYGSYGSYRPTYGLAQKYLGLAY